jgi:hypothetical protein
MDALLPGMTTLDAMSYVFQLITDTTVTIKGEEITSLIEAMYLGEEATRLGSELSTDLFKLQNRAIVDAQPDAEVKQLMMKARSMSRQYVQLPETVWDILLFQSILSRKPASINDPQAGAGSGDEVVDASDGSSSSTHSPAASTTTVAAKGEDATARKADGSSSTNKPVGLKVKDGGLETWHIVVGSVVILAGVCAALYFYIRR